MTPSLLHKIDLSGCDETFCEIVNFSTKLEQKKNRFCISHNLFIDSAVFFTMYPSKG